MEWVLIDGAGGKHLLDSGDTVLIVLNQTDYFDVLRRRFFGRAKRYFEKLDGSYALRPPPIGVWERWSDWSRVFSRCKIHRAGDSRELGSHSIDRDHPIRFRSMRRRSACVDKVRHRIRNFSHSLRRSRHCRVNRI
jgi:hypothetical protein